MFQPNRKGDVTFKITPLRGSDRDHFRAEFVAFNVSLSAVYMKDLAAAMMNSPVKS